MQYGEPETPRDPRQSIGATPQDNVGWLGGPGTGSVTWIGMPASQGWVGGAPVRDTWIGVEQPRPQMPLPRERQQLTGRDVVRGVDRGRGRSGRPVDRAKLPPFLQSHPRFRGHSD